MSASRVKVHIDRPCLAAGERLEAGRTVSLLPLDAAGVVSAGRGHLVDERDREAVREAVHQDTLHALRLAAQTPIRFTQVPR